MELTKVSFEDLVNHILYLKNFNQRVPDEMINIFLIRYSSEINTIVKDDTKQEAIRLYEKIKK